MMETLVVYGEVFTLKSSHRCSLQAYLMAVLGVSNGTQACLVSCSINYNYVCNKFVLCCNVVTLLVCVNPIYDNVQRE